MIRRYSKKEIYEISKLLEKSSLLSGYTNNYLGGEEIQKFETEFAKFHGCKYGISVNLGSIFTKIINLIYLLDFSTIYKSVFIGIDPSPVKSINCIKKNINVWNNIYDKKWLKNLYSY